MSPQAAVATDKTAPEVDPTTRNGLDRFFKISERGSTPLREVRGGLATFFAMAYIVVLNPIILASAEDKYHEHLSQPQLVTATVLVAAVMTILMGLIGNMPLALAAGLGINAMVAFQIAPQVSWDEAMGLVVLEGIGLLILAATGLREAIMNAIPLALKQAIGVGIGLFVTLVGLVSAGVVTRVPDAANTTVPVALGSGGTLKGWPALVFCFGLVLTFVLLVRKVSGSILIGMVASTVLAVVVHHAAGLDRADWGLTAPEADGVVDTPDFGLIGDVDLVGAFGQVGFISASLLIFTLLLSNFFDGMGTIIGVGREAGLLDAQGKVPGLGRILTVESVGAIAGGGASASSNTVFVESTAGVGEGARTGLANIVTGGLFALALLFTPLAKLVPAQAATPALVVVGALMMAQVKHIDWDDVTVAVPAFATIVLMPFTYSITTGIGAGFILYVVLKAATGKVREVPVLLWVVSALFVVHFAIDPVEQVLGVK
ncbi:NCS2 family permease [Embleya sp. NBC_00896]|uniref:NCS2 family permease n=1 Tax=Embleya sp. NBC_00896 TaxID=2975961 RepID=UPI00386D2A9A|nr:NCS2 family permease [Embleya sp. NBC_00896]